MKRFIDISGYGHSGKSIITDYLRQFDTVFSFPNHVEFELFRVSGGLLDLYYSIYQSWGLIRSTVAIDNFSSLVKRIGTIQTGRDPLTFFTASAHGYNQHFNNKFEELSKSFIDRVVLEKHYTFWPYENLRVSPFRVFLNKFNTKFFNSLTSKTIYYSNRNTFLQYASDYIHELFEEISKEGSTHVLLSNAFEPFNPGPCLDMVANSFSIIVDRDPRDIYASLINSKEQYVPQFENNKRIEKIKKNMTGFDDIDLFISKYKIMKENVSIYNDDRILRIRYEDFVEKHEQYSTMVKNFAGVQGPEAGSFKFSVENSKKNIGLWKKYPNNPEIDLIYKHLGKYCYQA